MAVLIVSVYAPSVNVMKFSTCFCRGRRRRSGTVGVAMALARDLPRLRGTPQPPSHGGKVRLLLPCCSLFDLPVCFRVILVWIGITKNYLTCHEKTTALESCVAWYPTAIVLPKAQRDTYTSSYNFEKKDCHQSRSDSKLIL